MLWANEQTSSLQAQTCLIDIPEVFTAAQGSASFAPFLW